MQNVSLYFDFVSPYAWLGLARARSFADEHGVCWDPRPVVYAKLLEAHGLLGPAETAAKRRYTFFDVLRAAERFGLRCTGPPAHPFRSLDALRLVASYSDRREAFDLALALADACWSEGRDLTDPSALADIAERAGLGRGDVRERIADPRAKEELRRETDEASRLGVFGVPTFVLDGELFWGHDRLSYLADRLAGRARPVPADVEQILARPQAVVRRAQRAQRSNDKKAT